MPGNTVTPDRKSGETASFLCLSKQFLCREAYSDTSYSKNGYAIISYATRDRYLDGRSLETIDQSLIHAQPYSESESGYSYGKINDVQIKDLSNILTSKPFLSLLREVIGEKSVCSFSETLPPDSFAANVSVIRPGGFVSPYNNLQWNRGVGLTFMAFADCGGEGGELYLFPGSASDHGTILRNLQGQWVVFDGSRHRAISTIPQGQLRYLDMEIFTERFGKGTLLSMSQDAQSAETSIKKWFAEHVEKFAPSVKET